MSEQRRPRDIDFEQKSEYLIFHNIEKRVIHRQALARWPLHITIVPPFQIPKSNERELRDLVRDIAFEQPPVHVQPGENDRFGPNFDVSVTKVVDAKGELQALHERFLWDLGSVGCHEIDMTYSGDRYVPHFTWKRGVWTPDEDEPFFVDTLSIAKKTDGIKTMLETVRLEY